MRLIAAFGAIYFIWGTSFLAIRVAVQSVPPFSLVALRTVIGALALSLWQAVRRKPLVPHSKPGWIILTGTLMFAGSHGLLAVVQQTTASGLAALMLAPTPLWLLLLDALFSRRAIPPAAGIGAIVGIAGVALLTLGSVGSATGVRPVSAALLLASGLCWASASLLTARKLADIEAIPRAVGQLAAGAVSTTAIALVAGEHLAVLSSTAALAIAYLGLVSSALTFCAYTWLLTRKTPATVGTYALVNPLVALLVGALLAGETINAVAAIAASLILASVWLVLMGERSGA